MQTIWFQDLKPSEREEFKKIVLGSQKVLDKLSEIVYNISKECDTIKSTDYDSPSWAFKQAHINGKVEAYNQIISILKLDKG